MWYFFRVDGTEAEGGRGTVSKGVATTTGDTAVLNAYYRILYIYITASELRRAKCCKMLSLRTAP